MLRSLIFIKQHWLAFTLAMLAAISISSLLPVEHLPPVPGSDKTHHFVSYGLLMFPLALRRPNYWPLIGLLFVGWGGAIELIQPYVNRYGEWLDFAANTGGLFCGLILALVLNYLFMRDVQKKDL